MKVIPKPMSTMKLYVWTDCVNEDYTAGDLCVMASTLEVARRRAADAFARGEFTPCGLAPWDAEPDRILSGNQAVHASDGGG